MRSGIGNSASDPIFVSGVGGANPGAGAPGTSANPTITQANGSTFTRTAITLSAGQAAGTAVFLAANATRHDLAITPPADCVLSVTGSLTAPNQTGWTLIGGLTNTFSGSACPTNDLYIYGLATGAVVTIMSA